MTERNSKRGLKEWFKAQPAPIKAAMLGALIIAILALSKAVLVPAQQYLSSTRTAPNPTVTLTSATASSGIATAALSPTPRRAATATPAPSVPSLYGTVFHDWNGNGRQDSTEAPGEPPLPGIRVCLDDSSVLCAVSDSNGQYVIDDVAPGEHTLAIDSQRYSFRFPSVDAGVALDAQDVPVMVEGRTLSDLGLGEGPLTLPFLCGDMDKVTGVIEYFDRDRRPGLARDWMGRPVPQDGYGATTIEVQGELQIVATAPGLVNYVGPDSDGFVVEVRSLVAVPWIPTGGPLWLYFYGLDEVSVQRGDTVARGQTLGRITGPGSGAGNDLGSLSLRAKYTDGYGSYIFIDLFRDAQTVGSHGLWTRDNDPVCFPGP
jgi:hypothetical protein